MAKKSIYPSDEESREIAKSGCLAGVEPEDKASRLARTIDTSYSALEEVLERLERDILGSRCDEIPEPVRARPTIGSLYELLSNGPEYVDERTSYALTVIHRLRNLLIE
jgi:hypothetical protein